MQLHLWFVALEVKLKLIQYKFYSSFELFKCIICFFSESQLFRFSNHWLWFIKSIHMVGICCWWFENRNSTYYTFVIYLPELDSSDKNAYLCRGVIVSLKRCSLHTYHIVQLKWYSLFCVQTPKYLFIDYVSLKYSFYLSLLVGC